jgi:hypothetical protein
MCGVRLFLAPRSYRLIHSFSSLSYDRSKASSKASSPHSAIQSFLLQMRVSSPFLKIIQKLPTSSSSSSCHFYPPFIFPSITSANYRMLLPLLGSVTAILCKTFSFTSLGLCYICRPYITSNLNPIEIFFPYSLKNNFSSIICILIFIS